MIVTTALGMACAGGTLVLVLERDFRLRGNGALRAVPTKME